MSYDLNISTVCNHKVYRELVSLGADRRSLRISKPLSSSNLEVFASDNLISKTKYTIIYDPETLTVQQPRMIYLKDKWKSVEDYFEVTYVTLKGFCPKCIGLGQLDDINYDIKGDLLKVRNEKLLLQNLEKFTVTEIGSNPFHSFIGTSLINLLGQRISDTSFIATKITQEINTTLEVLKSLQDQYRFAERVVTKGELLDKVEDIKVRFDEDDPTIIRTDVTVRAKSGQSVDFTQYMQLPIG